MTRVREFPLPDLGEGLTEGEILAWLVKEGDIVTQNQPIVEVETAKAAVEIPAKWAGKVTRIYHPAGTTVEVGSPLIAIDTDPTAGELPPDLPEPSAASLAAVEIAPAEGAIEPGLIGGPAPGGRTAVLVGYGPRTTSAVRRPRKAVPGVDGPPLTMPVPPVTKPSAPAAPAVSPRPAASAPVGAAGRESVLAKPPVRKLARDLGVDLYTIAGTGPAGSITRGDVESAGGAAPVDPPTQAAGRPLSVAVFGPDREQRIPIKGVRKVMAENMVASAFTAPHVTEFLTVDVTGTAKAVERLRARSDWQGVRVSPLLLAAKAALLAIGRHPLINSAWSGETGEIIVREYVNLGIAAATPRGLTVPNIKDAGRLSLRELAGALNDLVATAKQGRTAPADMAGGTFSITNVGVFGVDTGTPILPPGEAAILVFGAIRDQPWVHKGKIKVRKVTTLGLSFDHRLIDGELGSVFLRDVGAFLAEPGDSLLAWA